MKQLAKIISPLAWNVPIVDPKTGYPTEYFKRILEDISDAKISASLIDALGGDPDEDQVVTWDDTAGDLAFKPASDVLDMIDNEHGAILYRDSAEWLPLAPGTDGDVLTTHGTGADPTWETPSGGTGGTYTAYNVATAGDAFIDVLLDSDNGYAYDVIVKGLPSANAAWQLRMSDDNGATFKSGASDYKTQTTGASSVVALSGTHGSGRRGMVQFKLVGMNVVATENFGLTGVHHTVDSSGNPSTGPLGASPNGLGPLNYNAFRVLCSAGNMNAVTVWVKKII